MWLSSLIDMPPVNFINIFIIKREITFLNFFFSLKKTSEYDQEIEEIEYKVSVFWYQVYQARLWEHLLTSRDLLRYREY